MTRLPYRGRRYEVKRRRAESKDNGRWIAWCQTLAGARATAASIPHVDGYEVLILRLVDTRSGKALGIPEVIATFPKEER